MATVVQVSAQILDGGEMKRQLTGLAKFSGTND